MLYSLVGHHHSQPSRYRFDRSQATHTVQLRHSLAAELSFLALVEAFFPCQVTHFVHSPAPLAVSVVAVNLLHK